MRLSRRRLIASSTLAAVGALPFVRHLVPTAHAAPTGPKFLFVVYHPFGVVSPAWYPDTFGRDFKLKTCSAPLEEIRNDIILIQNLDNAMGEKNECENGWDQHSAGVCSIFSGATMKSDQEPGAPTIDSIIAKHLNPNAHHDDVVANLGVRSDEHKTAKNILKKSDGAVVVSQDDPSAAFRAIFGAGADTPKLPTNKPFTALKDALREDLKSFESSLALPERERFQQFMTSFADYERSLETGMGQVKACDAKLDTLTAPLVDGHRHSNIWPIARVQAQLGVMALSCGARRVVTLQLTGGFLGFHVPPGPFPNSGNFHGHLLSHHQVSGDAVKLRTNLNFHQAKVFAELVQGLKQASNPISGGSLFDDCLVLWGSCLSGNGGGGHSKLRVPFTLAAGKNTGFVTGRHVDGNFGTNSMLLRSIATSFGMPDRPFGDEEFSSKPLGGLFEDTASAGSYDRNVLDYYGTGKYPRCSGHVK